MARLDSHVLTFRSPHRRPWQHVLLSMVLCSFSSATAQTSIEPEKGSAQNTVSQPSAQRTSAYRAELPLQNYTPPSQAELFREATLESSDNDEAQLKTLELLVSGDLNPTLKKELIQRCSAIPTAQKLKPQKISDLVCVPNGLDEFYFVHRLVVSEARDETQLPPHVVSPQQWALLANKDFADSFKALKANSLDETMVHHKFFMQTAANCRFRNAGAALIAQAESWLPNPTVHEVIEDVYNRISPCLRPAEDGFERTHLRVGLLRLVRNDPLRAQQALRQAILAAEAREEQRTLFWLGVLAQTLPNGRFEARTNDYWLALMRRYPLEIHAILAAHALGQDPLDNLLGKDTITVRRRSPTPEFSAIALVAEVLHARGARAALRSWISQIMKQYMPPDPREILFLAYYANKSELYLESIGFLARYLKEMGAGNVNLGFLDLYFPRPFAKEILAHSATVDPVLLFALIRQESAFNPAARSLADARGLMQVIPPTARRFQRVSPQQLFDPTTNIRIGVRLIEELMKRFSGKAELVLSAYNAGPAHISRWKSRFPAEQELLFSDIIPFKETRGYVSSILRNAYWYGRLLTLQSNDIAKSTIARSNASTWRSTLVHNLLESVWKRRVSSSDAQSELVDLFELRAPRAAEEEITFENVVVETPELDSGRDGEHRGLEME